MASKLELESSQTSLSLVQSETGDVSAELVSAQPENNNISIETKCNEIKNDDHIFTTHGYKKIKKISETLQGELYCASIINKNASKPQYVAIKKTSKELHKERIAIRDEIAFCVSENILKEGIISKHLTMQNNSVGNYIITYLDFFQSDSAYYLVLEYIHSETNLKQFVNKASKYINNGQLNIKHYKKIIKYILWQIFVTVQWLHESIHCCHLDMCSSNIMLKNVKFTKTDNGIIIDPNITVRLTDFGVSEIFDQSFMCSKQGLTIDNECYAAPNVFNMDKYNAKSADNWRLGIIFFECMTLGLQLYEPMTMHHKESGFYALYANKLKQYLITQNLQKYFNSASYTLLEGLLNVKAKNRLNGMDILKQKYFKKYYQKYGEKINEDFNQQKQQTIQNKIKMKEKQFPFYKHY